MTAQRTMATTISSLIKQVKGNPLNWALLAILGCILRSYSNTTKPVIQEPKHPETIVFRNYTPLDLLSFDGNGKDGRILMAVNGSIFDVTRGKNFYGPGGPYANFAGHDASRGLAKNSFDADMLVDPKGPIDRLEDLSSSEWETLREWEQHFTSKYLFVGKFVENQ